jgi:hypothetical protein
MYHAYGLFPPDSDFALKSAADRLKTRFPRATIELNASEITLAEDDWDYHVVFQSGSDVLGESEGFAGHIAGLDDDTVMRTCDRRVEVWSDTPDPFMEHFEKHFQVLDVLRSFKGAILVDPKEPTLL